MTFKPPIGLQKLTAAALENGWTFLVRHGIDTGDSPFVSFEAQREGSKKVHATWHTRATGTYRLFSCHDGKRDMGLLDAIAKLGDAA